MAQVPGVVVARMVFPFGVSNGGYSRAPASAFPASSTTHCQARLFYETTALAGGTLSICNSDSHTRRSHHQRQAHPSDAVVHDALD